MSRLFPPILKCGFFRDLSRSYFMAERYSQIDSSLKRRLLEYPMPRLLRMLFPGMKVRDRGYMRSPFRVDRHPSFSCFTGRGGVSMGKDFATDKTYDNISLYMEVFPGMGYAESVDRLCRLVFGCSAYLDGGCYEEPVRVRENPCGVLEPEYSGSLEVVATDSLLSSAVPAFLKDYWRSRGISDDVVSSMCVYAVVRNKNRVGKILYDKVSGLPLCDGDGVEKVDDGLMRCIAMENEIGGYSLRTPGENGMNGFKGSTSSFISVYPSIGVRGEGGVVFSGSGDGLVTCCRVLPGGVLAVNGTQSFYGIDMSGITAAARFVSSFIGTRLGVREVRRVCAVLGCLGKLSAPKVAVVEGSFDAMSYVELFGRRSDTDLVVLNSLGNLHWAVPLLSVHRECLLYLDNDMSSKAGQKACNVINDEVGSFSQGILSSCRVVSCSSVLGGCKDLNDLLVSERNKLSVSVDAEKNGVSTSRSALSRRFRK